MGGYWVIRGGFKWLWVVIGGYAVVSGGYGVVTGGYWLVTNGYRWLQWLLVAMVRYG